MRKKSNKELIFISKFLLQPKHTNLHGSIFGGDLYSIMDNCAYMLCRDQFQGYDFVTKHSESHFKSPLFPGQILNIKGAFSYTKGSSAVKVDLYCIINQDEIVAEMDFVMISIHKKEDTFSKKPIMI